MYISFLRKLICKYLSRHYISTYDTLRPGDTSTLEECFGPKSGKKDDAKLLEAEFTVVNKDGSNTYIEYDTKLGTYTES
ncbi:MAG: hypothetical protein KIB43_04485 [Clostridium baratii]|uniref:hypothetical protein n=1 Tax=Clostridium baratii TaxID=1561 RepID=UPI0006C6B834|nr:hypothetical protein [Clostridium baratii]MBS6006193.1 hypothetical protein [Clostridium baratii]MDU1053268.1 hypothetical protein [Clostridium baratii]MDU4911206.1 hypothetical protein [Clostridium baratii]CUP10145.1 Uncharacterised protein [Clostridium baratii]